MFVSMIFPIFLGIVVALFFLFPVKWRPVVLLLASYAFCIWIGMQTLFILVLVSFCTWIAGKAIEKALEKEKKFKGKVFLAITVCFYVFMLCFYKYLPYCLHLPGMARQMSENVLFSLAMPVGLSFYLFQAIGYLVDIYNEKSRAESKFLNLSLYLAFFPKLVSGPIEREREFLSQIKELSRVTLRNRGRMSTVFTYMLWGYFMKLVVADRLAVIVNRIFGNPEAFDSLWLLLGVLFYTLQIYCDFAGYSYIAIGCAGIFGIKLVHNFNAPYLAENISDFWHRWHISLSTWLRDYLYIPLGGNRKGIVRKCINTVIVFLVCGMWHGAGFNFIVWGLLHGIYSVMEVLARRQDRKVKGSRMITFMAVAFAWIFFRADSFHAAVLYIVEMFTSGIHPGNWRQSIDTLQLNVVEIILIILGIAVIWAVDVLCDRRKLHLPMLIQQKQNAVRYFIFYLLLITIFIFGMYGAGYHGSEFIYMQF